MRTVRGEANQLEDVFSILRFRRFRRRGMVSFRKFIILSAQVANELQDTEGPTQPLRVMHR